MEFMIGKTFSVMILAFILFILVVGAAVFVSNKYNDSDKEEDERYEESYGDDNEPYYINENPQTYDIYISNSSYSPKTLTINSGDKVIWTNLDSMQHTVTPDVGAELSSSNLEKGETYSHIFYKQGIYNYHCKLHPDMKGTIIVK